MYAGCCLSVVAVHGRTVPDRQIRVLGSWYRTKCHSARSFAVAMRRANSIGIPAIVFVPGCYSTYGCHPACRADIQSWRCRAALVYYSLLSKVLLGHLLPLCLPGASLLALPWVNTYQFLAPHGIFQPKLHYSPRRRPRRSHEW